MARVQIDNRVNGQKLERFIAKHAKVQNGLDEVAGQIHRRAAFTLAHHPDLLHSYIETEKGQIDRYVSLNDTAGYGAAMSIEYGRYGGNRDINGNVVSHSDGLFILHKAARIGIMEGPKPGPFKRKRGDNGRD